MLLSTDIPIEEEDATEEPMMSEDVVEEATDAPEEAEATAETDAPAPAPVMEGPKNPCLQTTPLFYNIVRSAMGRLPKSSSSWIHFVLGDKILVNHALCQ